MRRIQLLLVFILLQLFFSAPAFSEQISGSYLNARGNIIKLKLTIKAPVPSSFILEQRLAKGTQVLSTRPKAQKISMNKGVVKWFFKDVPAGDQVVTLKIKPAQNKKPVGIIRYKDPKKGNVEVRF